MARTVRLTEDTARRMAAATRAYERGNRDQSPVMFRQAGGDDSDPVRLGKTSAIWNKGTLATITIWEGGTPPNENSTVGGTIANCVNKFATVPSGKFVMLARAGNGSWYLIAAEC